MKKWEKPELMILGVENTENVEVPEEIGNPNNPSWCTCFNHKHKYPDHPGNPNPHCPCCGQGEPSLS